MTTPRKEQSRGVSHANLTVQDAFHETVHNTPGIVPKQLAAAANIRYRELLDMANPYSGRKPRAHEVAPVINATFLLSGVRCCLIADVIERQIGRIAFALPTHAGQADAELVAKVGRVAKEFGEVLERLPLALDGHITQADADAIRKEWEDLVSVGAELMASIDAGVCKPAVPAAAEFPRQVQR